MLRKIEVFEGDTLHVGTAAAGLRQMEFDALVRFNDHHHGKYFEVGHKRIIIKGYVGYVEVADLSIAILPKADRSSAAPAKYWRRGLLEMLKIGKGLRLQSLDSASQREARPSLLELVASAFLVEVEMLLREGLSKGYRCVQSNAPVFRGRLMVHANLRENVVRRERFFVEYQTYDRDITINGILAAALRELAKHPLSSGVTGRILSCRQGFHDVSPLIPTTSVLERLHLGRTTTRYARALELARMILEHLGPALESGVTRVFALLFDMSNLWERYVAALFRRAAVRDTEVSTQETHQFWLPYGSPPRRVRPDIVIRASSGAEAGKALLVVDTKWKVPRHGMPADDDLKQMFVYNELLRGARAVLLYPAATEATSWRGPYAQRAHGCEQVHLGLFDANNWSTAAMVSQLSELIRNATRRNVSEAAVHLATNASAGGCFGRSWSACPA